METIIINHLKHRIIWLIAGMIIKSYNKSPYQNDK